MKTRYYLFGGQPAAPAYRWKGYTLPGLTRVAADTRGLSGEETEFLPYRASGPEPLDPGEGGTLEGIPIWDGLSDNEKKLAVVAAVGAAAWWFLKGRKGPRKNPSSKRGLWVWDWIGGGGNNHYGTRSEAVREAKSLGRPRTYMGRKSIELKVKPGSMRLTSKSYDDRFDGWD